MYSKFIIPIFLLLSTVSFSQVLTVEENIKNPSSIINDGIIEINVTGGTAPYSYKWSHQSTPLVSNKAFGLVEGVSYSVDITDAAGNTISKEFVVPIKNISERFNGTFTPIVNAIAMVLFWDPFSAIGIYDPNVYVEKKNIPIPGWRPGIKGSFLIKEWVVDDGVKVKEGDTIAIISRDGSDIVGRAFVSGTLKHLAKEGGSIYNSANKGDVIEEGAHNFAAVVYDEKIALTHPNGDLQKKEHSIYCYMVIYWGVVLYF